MSVQQDIKNIQNHVNNLIDSLKVDVDNLINDEVKIPDFDEIQKRKVLFESYRDVVIRNDKIVRKLTHIGKVIISLKDLKGSVGMKKSGLPPTLVKNLRYEMDNHLSKLFSYQKLLQEHKSDYDAAIKFFNSVQYTLTSPRLGGQE